VNDDSEHARSEIDPSNGRTKSAPGSPSELLPRRVFVQMRLAEIATRIADMAKEREQLTAALKRQPSEGGPPHKTMRQRRAYIAERLSIIRKEQADLNAERKALGADSGIADRGRREERGLIRGGLSVPPGRPGENNRS
jgi:uncharacterized coiled-coil DUF342 family protein